MWKFRWNHKAPVKRRMKGVVDCVRTAERIVARMNSLQTEITRLGSLPPEKGLAKALGIQRRMSRMLGHMERVKDIQADWAKK